MKINYKCVDSSSAEEDKCIGLVFINYFEVSSEIIVQDEAKSQDYVIFLSYLYTVDSYYNLCISYSEFNFLRMVSTVH